MTNDRRPRMEREAGSALYMTIVSLVVLLSISTAMIMVSTKTKEEFGAMQGELKARCLADSGLARALLDLNAGGTGILGSAENPVKVGEGSFYVATVKQSESLYVAVSHGMVGTTRKTLRASLDKKRGVFHHAMFIGNSRTTRPTSSSSAARGRRATS